MWGRPIKKSKIKNQKSKIAESKGFGLLEVMISLSILTVIVGAAVGLQITSTIGTQFAKHQTQAYSWASSCIEMIRQKRDSNWIDENSGTGYDSSLPSCNSSGTFGSDPVTFTRTGRVTDIDLDGDGKNESKQITVTVSWSERGKTRSVSLWTYLTDWSQL